MEGGTWAQLGTLIGSAVAAAYAVVTARRTKTNGKKNIGELVERLDKRAQRRNEVFVRAHVEEWELPRLLKELVAAEFAEAEREDIFRRKSNYEHLEG